MPELSRFYGIVIRMYISDHPPAHFHAMYGGRQVKIEIDTLKVSAGSLPPRALGMVMEWAAQHQDDLRRAWRQAIVPSEIDPIEPLG
ncbi:MAG: DUF4160 domain-containing protein [Phycisphaerales bacterium]